MVYYIPHDLKPTLELHGNSKSLNPYYPTLPSTLEAIVQSSSGGPKNVISSVSASVGGAVSANDPRFLPSTFFATQ